MVAAGSHESESQNEEDVQMPLKDHQDFRSEDMRVGMVRKSDKDLLIVKKAKTNTQQPPWKHRTMTLGPQWALKPSSKRGWEESLVTLVYALRGKALANSLANFFFGRKKAKNKKLSPKWASSAPKRQLDVKHATFSCRLRVNSGRKSGSC